jgi:hypothetical protein
MKGIFKINLYTEPIYFNPCRAAAKAGQPSEKHLPLPDCTG